MTLRTFATSRPTGALPVSRATLALAAASLAWTASCTPAPAEPPPPGSFAFGVYGDGPYHFWENARHRRLLADAEAAGLDWIIHVGDLLWGTCSDEALRDRRARFDELALPLVYTPGDNEWTDCHQARSGGHDPLERLDAIRRILFDDPGTSLGGRPMTVASQAATPGFAEFPENVLWTRGGFVFVTLHVVGSHNGTGRFDGRSNAHDEEVRRRTEAAIRWLEDAFARAHADEATGVVLIAHGNVRLENGGGGGPYGPLVVALERQVSGFPGPVLFIHGDTHEQRVDQPLRDAAGTVHENFTRLETFGSPDIGWVRVVVDTVGGRFAEFEPRRMRGWF